MKCIEYFIKVTYNAEQNKSRISLILLIVATCGTNYCICIVTESLHV